MLLALCLGRLLQINMIVIEHIVGVTLHSMQGLISFGNKIPARWPG